MDFSVKPVSRRGGDAFMAHAAYIRLVIKRLTAACFPSSV